MKITALVITFIINLIVNVVAAPFQETATSVSLKCSWKDCIAAWGVPAGSCIRMIAEENFTAFWQNRSCLTISANSLVNPPAACAPCYGKSKKEMKQSAALATLSSTAPSGPQTPGPPPPCSQTKCLTAMGYNIVACSRLYLHHTGNFTWNRASCAAATVGNLANLPAACAGCPEADFINKAESLILGTPINVTNHAEDLDTHSCSSSKAARCIAAWAFTGVSCARLFVNEEKGSAAAWKGISCVASAANNLANTPLACRGCTIKKEIHSIGNEVGQLFGLTKIKQPPKPDKPPPTPARQISLNLHGSHLVVRPDPTGTITVNGPIKLKTPTKTKPPPMIHLPAKITSGALAGVGAGSGHAKLTGNRPEAKDGLLETIKTAYHWPIPTIL